MTEDEIKALFDAAGIRHRLRNENSDPKEPYDVVMYVATRFSDKLYHDGYFATPEEAYKAAWNRYLEFMEDVNESN